MTTILILNAVAAGLAAAGLAGFLVWENRRVRRNAKVSLLHVATETSRPRPRD